MSPSDPDSATDPLALPPADDAERAETRWLLARDQDPSAPPPSPEVAKAYDQLEALLAADGSAAPDSSWQDDVFAAIRADAAAAPISASPGPALVSADAAAAAELPSPGNWRTPAGAPARARGAAPRWLRVAVPAATATAMAAMMALWLRSHRDPADDEVASGGDETAVPGGTAKGADEPELLAVVQRGGASRGTPGKPGSGKLGDLFELETDGGSGVELRVFADRTLVRRCPGPGCQASAPRWRVTVRLEQPTRYFAVLVRGEVSVSDSATLDEYLDAVDSTKLRRTVKSVQVQ
ncbi:MAG TPA: hypothetical protein PKU97_04295 [Kofleriaceae bacterium]|nr:hypothetical protein [Kofleriaceae bacterium]